MYQALYRKWRPKVFSEVVGQEHITDTLRRQVVEGHTAHAYLFTGTRGTGKTTCEACRAVDAGTTLEITELDAASNNGVDQVRALREEAVYTPAVLKKRVYIIDEVHMLSTPAFNALLKILEEPPEHLMFILATTELHKVPATILSRCQRFSFKRILPRDMERQLLHIAQAEKIDLTADGAEILSRMAGGALRDALSLLDQCRVAEGQLTSRAVLDVLGLAGSVQTQQMMRCILDRRTPDALLLLQRERRGRDVRGKVRLGVRIGDTGVQEAGIGNELLQKVLHKRKLGGQLRQVVVPGGTVPGGFQERGEIIAQPVDFRGEQSEKIRADQPVGLILHGVEPKRKRVGLVLSRKLQTALHILFEGRFRHIDVEPCQTARSAQHKHKNNGHKPAHAPVRRGLVSHLRLGNDLFHNAPLFIRSTRLHGRSLHVPAGARRANGPSF